MIACASASATRRQRRPFRIGRRKRTSRFAAPARTWTSTARERKTGTNVDVDVAPQRQVEPVTPCVGVPVLAGPKGSRRRLKPELQQKPPAIRHSHCRPRASRLAVAVKFQTHLSTHAARVVRHHVDGLLLPLSLRRRTRRTRAGGRERVQEARFAPLRQLARAGRALSRVRRYARPGRGTSTKPTQAG